jgi:hypothetical protein
MVWGTGSHEQDGICRNCGARIGPMDARCPSCGAESASDAGTTPGRFGLPASGAAALGTLRDRLRPSFSRTFSSASLRQDVLAGVLLSLAAVLLLVALIYLFLVLRGTFAKPSVPRTLGLLVFALLHGGSASVKVPPVPALLGIGGSAELGLPVSSFVLLPFVLLLVSGRYVARRARSGAAFALATTTS